MSEPLPVYEFRCIYCTHVHRSPYWDELEEGLLRCRDEAPNWKRGDIANFEDPGIPPISVETTAYAAGYV